MNKLITNGIFGKIILGIIVFFNLFFGLDAFILAVFRKGIISMISKPIFGTSLPAYAIFGISAIICSVILAVKTFRR